MKIQFGAMALLLATVIARGQAVEKVRDLTFFGDESGTGVGLYSPFDRFTPVGSNLWFTSSKGGAFDAGGIGRLDLSSTTVVQVASLDNGTGKAADGPLLVIGDEAYFTTVSGGAGNKGTIAKINLTNDVITTLHDFVTNGIPTGATPRGGLVRIGDALWGMTTLGGISNRGVMFRYNLTNQVTDTVLDFLGINGAQPYETLVPAGTNAWYYTTFTGGNTFATPGLSLGAGTLSRLSFDGNGAPVFQIVVHLPAGFTQFPACRPVLVGTNTLYFATVGPNATPGAIVRYDIDSGYWTNAFNFETNAASSLLYGKQPGYNGLVEWQDELYFMTRQGGSNNLGVIARYSPQSNTVTKLADLTGTNGLALGSNSGSFGNAGAVVEWDNRFYLYLSTPAGGSNNRGTILRIALPAPPLLLAAAHEASPGIVHLDWAGGYAPFTVEQSSDLIGGGWTVVTNGTPDRALEFPAGGAPSFFRVTASP